MIIGFVVGGFIGCLIGVVVMACLSANAYNKGYKDAKRELMEI
jgi:predicted PurR-regulated permease PerM